MSVHSKKVNILFAGFIMLLLTFFSWFFVRRMITSMTAQTRLSVCTADLMVNNFTSWRSSYFSYALVMADVLILLRNDFRAANLIAIGSRRRLWNRQAVQLSVHAAGYSVYYLFCTLFFSSRNSAVWMNWSDPEGYFFKVTKSLSNTAFLTVMAAFLAAFLLFWLSVSFVYLLLHWLLQKEILVWLAVFVAEFVFNRLLHCSFMASVSYSQWAAGAVLCSVIVNILVLAVIYAAGFIGSRKRQFYFERK